MQAVMDAEERAPAPDGSHAPVAAAGDAGDDSLDWGFAGGGDAESAPEDTPGQERLSFE